MLINQLWANGEIEEEEEMMLFAGVERMEGEAKAEGAFYSRIRVESGGKGKRRSQPAAMRVELYVWSGVCNGLVRWRALNKHLIFKS